MNTNLRAAMLAAANPSHPVAGVVLLTDAQHRDDITEAAAQLAATDVPVLVVGVDAAPRDARIASFDAVPKGNATQLTVQLLANVAALIDVILKAKPAAAKGIYFKRIAISTTMGPGVRVDPGSAVALATA